MSSMQGDLLGQSGHQAEHACESSAILIDPRHVVREMLSHPDFLRYANEERESNRKTCSEVFDLKMKEFITNARMWALTPILGLIGALLYIFNISVAAVNEANYSIRNLNNSVVELTVAVDSMKNHTARLQQENDKNRDGIDRLREQIYRK